MTKYNILYVDDEEANLRVFQASFRRSYNIFPATSAKEALKVLEQEDIQLVITDQKMPETTGVELLEKITPLYPEVIKIILTGYSDVKDIIRALNRCGIFRYIMKPWDKQEMQNTLLKALETYQLRKDNEDLVERLKTANEDLEKRIEERTRELSLTNLQLHEEITEREEAEKQMKFAKQRAEEASKAKEVFLSTMSHEMRTPLNAVIGMSNLLEQSDLNDEQRENLNILHFSATTLLNLISDILDFSKIEAGKMDLEKAPFNIRKFLNHIFSLHRNRAKEKELTYELILDNDLPKNLEGDTTRLGQILNNLLSNAMKFTETGGIQFKVEVLEKVGRNVELIFFVSDTGIGISKEKQEMIFEYFTQASSATTRKYGGTGLGLAISKKLTELLGGSMELESGIDHGSVFKLTLPFSIAETAKNLEEVVVENKDKDLSHLYILVAEDNKINQVLMRKVLSKWKARFAFADNGLIALEKMKEEKFDLVLMDIQMPEMDGYEATVEARKQGGYLLEIPILALTASTLQQDKDEAFGKGMNDFVIKPFNPDELYNKILLHSKKK